MADIELRLGRDVIVLAPPVDSVVEAMGVTPGDFALAMLVEPETIEEAYRRSLMAGAGCLVTPTGWLTRARLAHLRLEDKASALVDAAFSPIAELRPQHVLAEIGPCGLPFDSSSQASIKEHRHQYAPLVSLLTHKAFDGFLLDGFRRLGTLRPALDAIKALSERPIFVEVEVDADGRLVDGFEGLDDFGRLADEYQLTAVGMRVAFPLMSEGSAREVCTHIVQQAKDMVAIAERPVLVSLSLARAHEGENGSDAREKLDWLIEAAERLRDVGVQFLRVVGADAGILETAVLAGAVGGMEIVTVHDSGDDLDPVENEAPSSEDDLVFKPIPEDIIARFSARVDAALRGE